MWMRRAPASSAFSSSSFTTDAGRSTTSPAAILLATCSGSTWMRPMDQLSAVSNQHSGRRTEINADARRRQTIQVVILSVAKDPAFDCGKTTLPLGLLSLQRGFKLFLIFIDECFVSRRIDEGISATGSHLLPFSGQV